MFDYIALQAYYNVLEDICRKLMEAEQILPSRLRLIYMPETYIKVGGRIPRPHCKITVDNLVVVSLCYEPFPLHDEYQMVIRWHPDWKHLDEGRNYHR